MMSNDISRCKGIDCKKKSKCYRFVAIAVKRGYYSCADNLCVDKFPNFIALPKKKKSTRDK